MRLGEEIQALSWGAGLTTAVQLVQPPCQPRGHGAGRSAKEPLEQSEKQNEENHEFQVRFPHVCSPQLQKPRLNARDIPSQRKRLPRFPATWIAARMERPEEPAPGNKKRRIKSTVF
jgi:hypothetical protein